MGKHTVLTIQFRAETIDTENPIPEDTSAEERVSLTIPSVESKYVVFPKVLEGVTDRVITEHRAKVSAYLNKKAAEEKRRREWQKAGLWVGDGEPPSDEDAEEDGSIESVELSLNGHTVGVGKNFAEAAQRMREKMAPDEDETDE